MHASPLSTLVILGFWQTAFLRFLLVPYRHPLTSVSDAPSTDPTFVCILIPSLSQLVCPQFSNAPSDMYPHQSFPWVIWQTFLVYYPLGPNPIVFLVSPCLRAEHQHLSSLAAIHTQSILVSVGHVVPSPPPREALPLHCSPTASVFMPPHTTLFILLCSFLHILVNSVFPSFFLLLHLDWTDHYCVRIPAGTSPTACALTYLSYVHPSVRSTRYDYIHKKFIHAYHLITHRFADYLISPSGCRHNLKLATWRFFSSRSCLCPWVYSVYSSFRAFFSVGCNLVARAITPRTCSYFLIESRFSFSFRRIEARCRDVSALLGGPSRAFCPRYRSYRLSPLPFWRALPFSIILSPNLAFLFRLAVLLSTYPVHRSESLIYFLPPGYSGLETLYFSASSVPPHVPCPTKLSSPTHPAGLGLSLSSILQFIRDVLRVLPPTPLQAHSFCLSLRRAPNVLLLECLLQCASFFSLYVWACGPHCRCYAFPGIVPTRPPPHSTTSFKCSFCYLYTS